jgi:hypothetical protein
VCVCGVFVCVLCVVCVREGEERESVCVQKERE